MAGLVRPSSKKMVGPDGRLALEWDAFFSALLNAVNSVSQGSLVVTQVFTVATVPDAAEGAGRVIYVSDESGGAVLAFSDGTNWRRVTDRTIIS
jgi:hypothetical protein